MSSQIEEIKSRVNVVDLVGSYIRLTKAGANFRALCPFHNEKTPSFNVSPARQIWHCFGCGKGGDAFQFIQEIDGVEFVDALRTLADRAGVELKREDPQFRSERARQFALLEEAAKFFERNLAGRAPEYLKKRGVEDETIKTFRLGYAPDEWRMLSAHLKTKGFSDIEIEKSGLAVRSGQGFYDRFRGRIIFPISDYNGRVVAFGGRVFPEKSNEGKYINSPETALYQKSQILYGLNKSKTEILRATECVVVEGYMDAIMSWQGGVRNVVASSGTALAEGQLKILRRLAEKLIVAFDMDLAGEGASKRGISLALAGGFDVRVAAALGEGFKDPADAVLADPKIWSRAVANARHIAQFYIDSVLKKHKPSSSEAKREFQRTVLPVVSSLPELEKAHWVREVSNILNIKEEAVWAALDKANREPVRAEEAISGEKPEAKTRKQLLEEKILGIVAEHPTLWGKLDPSLEKLVSAGSKAGVFAEIFLAGIVDAEAEFMKCQTELKKEYLKERLERLAGEIGGAERAGSENLNALLAEFHRVSKELAQI